MRLLYLTAGTGSFYCGTCLRDGTLVKALRELGHDALLAPLYLPLVLEEAIPSERVHLGGINAFLAHRGIALPRFVQDWLDSPRLLSWTAGKRDMTGARSLGELTHAMLLGEDGSQASEVEKLLSWLATLGRVDAILLSNGLLLGLAKPLARALGAPVLCSLQGEAPYLDALVEPWRERCWKAIGDAARDVEAFLPVSGYTRALMVERARLASERMHLVPNGIELDGFTAATVPPDPPAIGYLARLCRDKGLPTLFEAFLRVRRRPGCERVRLIAAGTALEPDRALVRELERRARAAGLSDAVEFHADVTRDEKIALLARCSVFSVPATYGESFGLYLLEAWAMGLPVVQPEHAVFPELLGATGGGVLCRPDDPDALASALGDLLLDPERARRLGRAGQRAVEERYTHLHMARAVERICRISAPRGAPAPAH